MKFHFTRESPKTQYYRDYRDYRKFDINYFSSEFSHQLDSTFCSIKNNENGEELMNSVGFIVFHRVFPAIS